MSKSSPRVPLSIPALRAVVEGRVIAPGDADYDAARSVAVGGIDRRPAVIVRAAGARDVARVIGVARETELELAVRSGGHSGAGHGTTEGGILLDLSAMNGIEVDVEARTVWAEAGLTAGELTVALQAHGLAVGFGDTASVGIGGITTGGGVGYLVRRHGLTIDSLLAGRRGHGRRRAGAGRRRVPPGPLLGDPRRRRQLRGRGPLPVPPPRGWHDRGRDADPAGHGRNGRRVHRGSRGRTRRALDDRERHAGPADAVPGAGAPRQARRDGAVGPRRRSGGRPACGRALPRARRRRSPTSCGRWPTRSSTLPRTPTTTRSPW